MSLQRKTLTSPFFASRSLFGGWKRSSQIRATIPWLYLPVFAAGLGLVAALVVLHLKHSCRQEMDNWRIRLASIASDRVQDVVGWIEDRECDARIMASRSEVRNALQVCSRPGRPLLPASEAFWQLQVALDEAAGIEPHTGLYVLDRNGHAIAQSSGTTPVNAEMIELCRRVSATGMAQIGLMGDNPEATLLGIATPVFAQPTVPGGAGAPGPSLGVALVEVDASNSLFPLLTREPVPTRTAETLLARREGDQIVLFSMLRHLPAHSRALRFPLARAPGPARLSLQASESFTSYPDYRGVVVLAATRFIPSIGWGLVRKIDRAEALDDFRRQAFMEVLATAFLVLTLGSLAGLHRRRLVNRALEREGSKFRALLDFAPDAIYVIDPSSLRIVARNRKAAEMDGYSEEELAQLTASDLHPPDERWAFSADWGQSSHLPSISPDHMLHHRNRAGAVVPVEERHAMVEVGGERLALSIIHDISERLHADEALRKISASLAEAQRLAHVGSWQWDIVRDRAWLSEEMCRILGALDWRAPLSLEQSLAYIHRDDRASVQAALTAALQNLEPYHLDYRVVRPGGGLRHVHAEGEVIRDPAGKPLRMVGSVQDITERVEAETQRAHLGNIIAASGDAIIGKSLDGIIQSWNHGAEVLFGYLAEEAVGQSIRILAPLEKQEEITAWLGALRRGERVERVETIRVRKDGRRIDVSVSVSPIRDAAGRVVGGATIARDITERKRAEEAAARLSRQVQSLLEAAGEGVYGLDNEGALTFVNPAATRMLGYEAQEVLGRRSHALWHHTRPDGAAFLIEDCPTRATLRTGATTQGEDWFWRKDGGGFPVQLAVAPVKEAGKVIGTVVTFSDITERKRAEAALKQRSQELLQSQHALQAKVEELARSNAELEQFAYIASHDLQEPLRTVASFAQLLQKRYQGKIDANADDFIHFMVDGATRMQGLINDLLAYSRVGRRGREFVPTHCTKLVEQALRNLHSAIAESGAVVTYDPLPTLNGDGEQLTQVFQNLIGNGIKFHAQQPPRVHVSAVEGSAGWVFSVIDNGIGIDPQYAERIFEIFQRLHTHAAYPGSGIGLAIAKKIVERHGGRIWVESQVNQGATFHFTLPGVAARPSRQGGAAESLGNVPVGEQEAAIKAAPINPAARQPAPPPTREAPMHK